MNDDEQYDIELRQTIDDLRAKNSKLERLLKEAYIFIGMRHKNLQPWRIALDNLQDRIEEQTGWNHFQELQKFENETKISP